MHKSRESIDKQQRAMKNDMRSITELITILRDNIVENGVSFGMCGVLLDLYWDDKITRSERFMLIEYLNKHKPIKAYFRVYWFRKGESEPRINWLNKQLRILLKNTPKNLS